VTAPALNRRRDQASAAATAAEKAQAGVTELDNRLKTNATLTTQQNQALRNAVAEVNRLKRSLKAAAKEREQLTKARKKAVDKAAKSKAKAAEAEAKYDKVVLADLVRREKEKDRAASPSASNGKASRPAPEQTDTATATAVRTAARKTAADAGVRTPRTRRTN
jgi:chromosome segregation ATPase